VTSSPDSRLPASRLPASRLPASRLPASRLPASRPPPSRPKTRGCDVKRRISVYCVEMLLQNRHPYNPCRITIIIPPAGASFRVSHSYSLVWDIVHLLHPFHDRSLFPRPQTPILYTIHYVVNLRPPFQGLSERNLSRLKQV